MWYTAHRNAGGENVYIYNRNSLPEPVFEGHEDWVQLYYSAWETAFNNVEYVRKEGWKPQLTCMPGVGVIWQWDSCFMTFITNYSNGTLNALNNLDNLYRLRNKETGFNGDGGQHRHGEGNLSRTHQSAAHGVGGVGTLPCHGG